MKSGRWRRAEIGLASRSSAVSTVAPAGLVIERTVPAGTGLRTKAAWRVPGCRSATSAVNRPSPRTRAGSSNRRSGRPIQVGGAAAAGASASAVIGTAAARLASGQDQQSSCRDTTSCQACWRARVTMARTRSRRYSGDPWMSPTGSTSSAAAAAAAAMASRPASTPASACSAAAARTGRPSTPPGRCGRFAPPRRRGPPRPRPARWRSRRTGGRIRPSPPPAFTQPGQRDPLQQLMGLQRGGEHHLEEVGGGDGAGAVGAAASHLGVEGPGQHAPLGGRVGVGQAPAEGAPHPDRVMAHPAGGVGQQPPERAAVSLRSNSRWRTLAPTATVSGSESSMAASSLRRPMSTITAGRASRKFMAGTRLWPPASTLASSPCSCRSESASSTVSGRSTRRGRASRLFGGSAQAVGDHWAVRLGPGPGGGDPFGSAARVGGSHGRFIA